MNLPVLAELPTTARPRCRHSSECWSDEWRRSEGWPVIVGWDQGSEIVLSLRGLSPHLQLLRKDEHDRPRPRPPVRGAGVSRSGERSKGASPEGCGDGVDVLGQDTGFCVGEDAVVAPQVEQCPATEAGVVGSAGPDGAFRTVVASSRRHGAERRGEMSDRIRTLWCGTPSSVGTQIGPKRPAGDVRSRSHEQELVDLQELRWALRASGEQGEGFVGGEQLRVGDRDELPVHLELR